jgi:isoquinoline 1-oxidoreductase beta subunit
MVREARLLGAPGPRRREVLIAGAALGSGLPAGFGAPATAAAATETFYRLNAWVSIAADGTVQIPCGSQDMGQGIYSGLAQIVAEELRANWANVVVGPAPLAGGYDNPLYHAQITAGSASVRGYFNELLEGGAIARTMLIEAGAAALGVPAANCIAMGGAVVDQATGKSVTFGAVAEAASKLAVPKSAPLYSKSGYVLVGQAVARQDIQAKVTGAAVYGMDVVVPGMVFGAVKLCPTRGGTVAKVGAAPTGSQIVNLGVGIAAVVQPGPNCTTWAAIQAVTQTSVTWTVPANAAQQTTKLIVAAAESLLTTGTPIVAETAGDVATAQAGAARVLTLTYVLPYVQHATLETPNCTASVTAKSCTLWAATQDPGGAQATAAAITGLPLSAVHVNCVQMGGGLGRKLEQDFVAYAVMASKAVGRPVQMVFSREQDFSQDQYRPMAVCRVTIGLDKHGNIVSWAYRNVSPSILGQRNLISAGQLDSQASEGSTALPYALANRQIDWVAHPATIPVGFWRSVGNSINCFAVESAIDEAALAAGVDPLAYRQRLMAGNTRALAVLEAVSELSGWTTPPIEGTARGLAFNESFGTLVALVVQITEVAGVIQLQNAACVVDCGLLVNPGTAEQQVQGGMVQGFSAALWGQMLFKNGVAQTLNFDFARFMRLADMPSVQVQFIQTPGVAMGGVGEVGVPCVAPAVANAWARLTRVRLRSLPLFPAQI